MSGSGTGGDSNYSATITMNTPPAGYKWVEIIKDGVTVSRLVKIGDSAPPPPPAPNSNDSTQAKLKEIIKAYEPVKSVESTVRVPIGEIILPVTLQQFAIDTDPLYDSGDSDTIFYNNGWQNYSSAQVLTATKFMTGDSTVLGTDGNTLWYWTAANGWVNLSVPGISWFQSLFYYNGKFYFGCREGNMPKLGQLDTSTLVVSIFSVPRPSPNIDIDIVGVVGNSIYVEYMNSYGRKQAAYSSTFTSWTTLPYYLSFDDGDGGFIFIYFTKYTIYNGNIYAIGNTGYIYSGGTWVASPPGIEISYPVRIHFPVGSERLLSTDSSGASTYALHGTTKDGTISAGFKPPDMAKIAYGRDGKILFFFDPLIKYTTNYGVTWQTGTQPPPLPNIYYDPTISKFVAKSPTVTTTYVSTNGDTWSLA